jgi:septal ring factor EnvC (AmiA/AmiB activator)
MKPRRAALEAERVALERSHTAIAAAEERELAFRRAFSSDWKPSAHTAVYAGRGPLSTDDVRSGFARLRGRLPFPLTGRAEIRRARRLSGGAGATVGLELMSMPGAAVRSVFPGRVAFADAYADYGPAVIVDHGAGYYTVSAGLETLEVEVGDEVAGGDRLGTVAATAEGAVLYFEVRKGSEALDPSPWFGI